MSQLALYLLGSPRIELDGEPVHIGRRKALAMLAYITVEPVRHSRDTLATLLWPERDQSSARADLRRTLSQLNQALGEGWLATDREGAGLNPEREPWLDVIVFRQHLAQAAAHGHLPSVTCPGCLPHLEQAVELHHGDFMAGFTLRDSLEFDEWQFFQTQSLRDGLARVLERLVTWHRTQGEVDRAIAYARRWLALDSAHEPAHCHLMALYAQAGQGTAALRQYEVCQEILADELGLPPAPETTDLYERLRSGEALSPEYHAVPIVPHNLPPQSTPFIGREGEMADLRELVSRQDTRLVTILGPGGVGKTRLALAVAEEQLRATTAFDGEETALFRDGVFFVPLARVSAAEHMAPAVAEGLGFQFAGGESGGRTPEQQVLDYLREKHLLLLLDNLEHLSEGYDFVTKVLLTAPGVRILGTSRERLCLYQEQGYPIRGLAYPGWEMPPDDYAADGDYPAGRLFVQAARRVQPAFRLTGEDVATLARICRLLEGLPLGIELAASWANTLSLADIAAEVERSLDFLATEWRDVPTRHRSLRATIDVSWNLLNDAERNAFVQLSIFSGGFTRAAAREVAGADLRTLARLVDRSLLRLSAYGERYQVHELLRQYAADKLAANPSQEALARDRHGAFFCAILGRRSDDLNLGKDSGAIKAIESDWANMRVAWERAACQGNVALLDQALDGLIYFFDYTGRRQEGAAMFQLAIAGLTGDSKPFSADGQRVLALALLYRAGLNYTLGRGELARLELQRGKALLEDPALSGCDTRREQAHLHVVMGREAAPDWELSREHFQQALTLQRGLGYEGQVAFRHLNIGWTLMRSGERDQARQSLEKGLALFRAFRSYDGMHLSLAFLGGLAVEAGDFGEAKARYKEILSLAREHNIQSSIADALSYLGNLALDQGDFQDGISYLHESAHVRRAHGDRAGLSDALNLLSLAYLLDGQFDQAYARIEESLAIAEETKVPGVLHVATAFRAWLDAAVGKYTAARTYAEKSIAVFQDRANPEAFTTAQLVLGWAALAEGQYEEAEPPLQTSIAVSHTSTLRKTEAEALAALGRAAHGLGGPEEAHAHFFEALEIVVEIRLFIPLLQVLPMIAVVLVDADDPHLKARGVQLYALARSLPFVAKAQLFEDVAGRHIKAATASLPPEVVAAAQERGRALDWWETAEALLEELTELGWSTAPADAMEV
jgi:predicted ATPase/DNA-binding SARP family transcriptional activator/Tfp pilus assembly protein PilF